MTKSGGVLQEMSPESKLAQKHQHPHEMASPLTETYLQLSGVLDVTRPDQCLNPSSA